jgi:hypothetical protein
MNKFKIGDTVYDIVKGEGVVVAMAETKIFVKFPNYTTRYSYSLDGRASIWDVRSSLYPAPPEVTCKILITKYKFAVTYKYIGHGRTCHVSQNYFESEAECIKHYTKNVIHPQGRTLEGVTCIPATEVKEYIELS